eukprot:1685399-Pyramimonas_sp.AAC.2
MASRHRTFTLDRKRDTATVCPVTARPANLYVEDRDAEVRHTNWLYNSRLEEDLAGQVQIESKKCTRIKTLLPPLLLRSHENAAVGTLSRVPFSEKGRDFKSYTLPFRVPQVCSYMTYAKRLA